MRVSEMFPKKYATGEDLKGRHLTLTIAAVEQEKSFIPGKGEQKIFVIYFENAQKGIILNNRMAYQIAAIYGDETESWTGKRITIYPVPMTVAGEHRIAIRAKKPANGDTSPPAEMVED